MRGIEGRGGVALVEALAGFVPKTSATALRQSLASAGLVASVLGDNLVFGAFSQVRTRVERGELGGPPSGAHDLVSDVMWCLRQDETNTDAARQLRGLAERAQAILHDAVLMEVRPERRAEREGPTASGPGAGPVVVPVLRPDSARPQTVLVEGELRASGREAVLAELRAALARVEAAVAGADEAVTLSGTFRVTGGVASGSRRKGS